MDKHKNSIATGHFLDHNSFGINSTSKSVKVLNLEQLGDLALKNVRMALAVVDVVADEHVGIVALKRRCRLLHCGIRARHKHALRLIQLPMHNNVRIPPDRRREMRVQRNAQPKVRKLHGCIERHREAQIDALRRRRRQRPVRGIEHHAHGPRAWSRRRRRLGRLGCTPETNQLVERLRRRVVVGRRDHILGLWEAPGGDVLDEKRNIGIWQQRRAADAFAKQAIGPDLLHDLWEIDALLLAHLQQRQQGLVARVKGDRVRVVAQHGACAMEHKIDLRRGRIRADHVLFNQLHCRSGALVRVHNDLVGNDSGRNVRSTRTRTASGAAGRGLDEIDIGLEIRKIECAALHADVAPVVGDLEQRSECMREPRDRGCWCIEQRSVGEFSVAVDQGLCVLVPELKERADFRAACPEALDFACCWIDGPEHTLGVAVDSCAQ
eukprot:comp19487_c0_seq1/m.37022 comp19487_c0_seq1/g.37022  ORF comp19487_c0_seq1/g.37022 comp19487_c0_seq1/m.37022 type:complete len:437 (-) comp19487_c0_seq1:279-1589(-)